jgi:hypothetical protein
MARFIFNSNFQDQNGRAVGGGTVTVALAGTSTAATIYSASTGAAQADNTVTSSTTGGQYSFYVDETDYDATQRFKITLSKNGYASVEYDDIAIFPLLTGVSQSADMTAVTDGFVIWQSNGTGTGDDGDIMIRINDGSTTKTTTLVDFSTL